MAPNAEFLVIYLELIHYFYHPENTFEHPLEAVAPTKRGNPGAHVIVTRRQRVISASNDLFTERH